MFLIYRGREENITTPAIIKTQLKDSVWHKKFKSLGQDEADMKLKLDQSELYKSFVQRPQSLGKTNNFFNVAFAVQRFVALSFDNRILFSLSILIGPSQTIYTSKKEIKFNEISPKGIQIFCCKEKGKVGFIPCNLWVIPAQKNNFCKMWTQQYL